MKMNMKVLKKTRKRPTPGDIFVLQVRDNEYLFGRIIALDTKIGGCKEEILIYIYSATSTKKTDIPVLDKRNLLLPPLAISWLPWCRGYFETVINQQLKKDDILPRHCFEDTMRNKYFDEWHHYCPVNRQ